MSSVADGEKLDLNGAGVLITRPRDQSRAIKDAVSLRGGQPFVFPCLQINPVPSSQVSAALRPIQAGDIVIFISANAVRAVFNEIGDKRRRQLSTARLSAVGERTREALEAEQMQVRIVPEPAQQNSEGLLANPLLQKLSKKRVFIIRGQAGREALRDTLTERGAEVEYIQAYTRSIPKGYDNSAVIRALDKSQIQFAMLTSYAAYENLCSMLGERAVSLLETVQLIVPGKRVASKITYTHPHTLIQADNASDEAMLSALDRAS